MTDNLCSSRGILALQCVCVCVYNGGPLSPGEQFAAVARNVLRAARRGQCSI